MIRPNDGNWSFSLLDGQNIEVSAVISNNGSGITTQIGLEHDYGYGKNNWIVSASTMQNLTGLSGKAMAQITPFFLSLTPAMQALATDLQGRLRGIGHGRQRVRFPALGVVKQLTTEIIDEVFL